MLQRLFAVAALLASTTSLGEAMNVHVRINHKHHGGHKHHRAATGSGSAASSTVVGDTSNHWSFSPVKSIQARVQGNAPSWDATTKTWVASFGKTYEQQFRSVLDTVNTASVEGALMYVQAEGINVKEQSVQCERKNKMQYIVFYEMTFVQPNASMALYGAKDTTGTLEYCPYVAMDGGACTKSGEDYPDACKQYDGLSGQPKLGHCVGAGEQVSDKRAPYPGNYWFSYPNSCVTQPWANKTDSCRTEYPGGLCAPGATPDGVNCTYTYSILGYLNIDDLVGITDGSAVKSGTKYGNYTQFCNAGNVEFSATNTGSGFVVNQSIAFWEKPGDESANVKRTTAMVDMYNKMAPKVKTGTMTGLPEVTALVKANPSCYKNNKDCATATNGCRRTLYSQICEVCSTYDSDCVKAPSGYTFPTLTVPKPELSSASGSGSDMTSPTANSTEDKPAAANAATSAAYASATMVVGMMVAATLL